MQITKRDLIAIVALSIVFFAMATWNLGLVQAPVTNATLSDGQSFYVDLGNSTNVKSALLLYKDGHFNLTISVGSPGNWRVAISNDLYPYDFSNKQWSLDYYKWHEVSIQQTTQYVEFNFSQSSSEAIISEIVFSSQTNQLIQIVSINNAGSGNPILSNLVDEQGKVQLPITYMSQTYFDEIYFVRTAEQYLTRQWPYEWTHPPLGKLIQAAGIEMFGLNPFGWRLMGVIFGMLMIPVMYLLGKRLLGTWIGGFASAFLLAFDFMHFTMARMGTADTYVVFFSLLAQLSFFIYFSNVVKDGWKTSVLPLFLAVIFFFLGFSTKWLVLWAALGLVALLAALRIRDLSKIKEKISMKYAAFFDHPFLLLMGFIALGVGIYFLSYVPDMIIGRPLYRGDGSGVIDLQFAMYNYHATLVAKHDFASAWWSWPFMTSTTGYVPLWLWVTDLPNAFRSTISVLGNPAVWWVGFASIIAISFEVIGGDKIGSLLRTVVKRGAQSQGGAQDLEAAIEIEDEKKRSEARTKLRNSATVLAGFLVFITTAILSEIFNYHSFLLAVPTYAGLFLTVYGMLRNIGDKHEIKDIAPIFIITVFFFSWIPYTFLSRVTFIYHFYVSVPLLCLATAYFISKYWNSKAGKIAAFAVFAAVIVLFIVFYPITSGVPASKTYIESLKWFRSWYF